MMLPTIKDATDRLRFLNKRRLLLKVMRLRPHELVNREMGLDWCTGDCLLQLKETFLLFLSPVKFGFLLAGM